MKHVKENETTIPSSLTSIPIPMWHLKSAFYCYSALSCVTCIVLRLKALRPRVLYTPLAFHFEFVSVRQTKIPLMLASNARGYKKRLFFLLYSAAFWWISAAQLVPQSKWLKPPSKWIIYGKHQDFLTPCHAHHDYISFHRYTERSLQQNVIFAHKKFA